MEENRLLHIDQLKGFAIILVVIGHIIFLSDISFFENTDATGTIIPRVFIYTFHMPLFFMLSGLLADRMSKKSFIKNFASKFRALILPYIFMGSIYCIFQYNGAFKNMYIYESAHQGYWFILALFLITALFLCMKLIYSVLPPPIASARISGASNWLYEFCILLLPFFIFWLLEHFDIITVPTPIGNILSLSMVVENYRYFILGYFLGKYQEFDRLLRKPAVVFLLMLGFIILLYLQAKQHAIYSHIPYTLVRIILCLSIYAVFRANSDKIQKTFSKLSFIGRRSLDIYLIHGLFMLSSYPITANYWLLDILIKLLMSVILLGIAILTGSLIRSNKYAAFLFFGQKLK
ncbi:MAG: acyltransferase family protein [Prevotella sp.]|jgi:fucose 4-O-acetylase-like acetyltransferase|nr:acyltransferase family protein [Prevotella sp.]